MKKAVAGVAAGVVGLAISAVGTAAPHAASAAEPVTFTVGIQNEVDSFNPFLGIEAESYEMWALMYDPLIKYSPEDMSPQPGLASDWKTSSDGLTWTFTIRDDVKWSDGKPLTSEDVAYTLNRILDGGPESATWGSYLKSINTITAPNPTTVVMKLSEPNAVLPLLPMPILPKHIWSDISEEEVKSYANEDNVVGSGPFRLVDGTAGGSIYRFEANKDYWDGAPNIDQVVFSLYKAEDPMVQALQIGDIDFAEGVSPLQLDAIEGTEGIKTVLGTSPGFDEIAFNTGSIDLDSGDLIGDPNPAVMDPEFRYALGFAIDRETIADKIYQGAGEPADTIIPPAYSTYHWSPPDDIAFSYDPERAGELLDAAGYTMGDDGSRTMPDGSPIGTLRLLARTDSQYDASLKTMTYFKEWLADIGIDSEVTAMESGKLTNVILDGEFDAFQWGWYVEPDPDSMLSYMTCGQLGSWSDSWYCNDEYDQLYNQQHSELDEATRAETVKRMQEILFRDSPYLVTIDNKYGEAYRCDRFEGFVPQPGSDGVLLFQYGVNSYLNIYPTTECGQSSDDAQSAGAATATTDDGISTATIIGVGVAVLAVVGGAGAVIAYRKSTADKRA
ncbi:MAG TPA: ABC transporter substrate-binding protein [Nocardioidaceae bacterium]|nr:ABC transporter substrate-binding protein [Nocardioidaceae bacterium]